MHYDSSSRLHRNLHGTQKDTETKQFSLAVCDKQTNGCVAKLTVSVTETQCFGKCIHLCHQVKSGKPTQLHPLKDVINRKLKGISYEAAAEARPHYIVNEGYALFKQQY